MATVLAVAVDPGMAAIITAFATTGVMLGGYLLARRGQKEQNQQQAAATSLAALEKRSDRAEAAEVRERERAERAEAEVDEQRTLHRHQVAEQESRCRSTTSDLTDAVVTLRAVVMSEVAAAAATDALSKTLPHPHDEPTSGAE